MVDIELCLKDEDADTAFRLPKFSSTVITLQNASLYDLDHLLSVSLSVWL